MPFNKTKVYNQLLEIDHLQPRDRTVSLRAIFDRDFVESGTNLFRKKEVQPTPENGVASMENLFGHLTTEIVDRKTKKREFETHRAKRIHWIRFHLQERLPGKLEVFSCHDKRGIRTYVYDASEFYVIVLEPLRVKHAYYLLTAYYLSGKNKNKIKNKKLRKLPDIH